MIVWSQKLHQPQQLQPQPPQLPQQLQKQHPVVVLHIGQMTYGVMMKTTMQVAILMVEPAVTTTTMAGTAFARYLS